MTERWSIQAINTCMLFHNTKTHTSRITHTPWQHTLQITSSSSSHHKRGLYPSSGITSCVVNKSYLRYTDRPLYRRDVCIQTEQQQNRIVVHYHRQRTWKETINQTTGCDCTLPILCLIPRTTVTSLSTPKDTRCKPHPLCVNPGVPFWTREKTHKLRSRWQAFSSWIRADVTVVLEVRQSIVSHCRCAGKKPVTSSRPCSMDTKEQTWNKHVAGQCMGDGKTWTVFGSFFFFFKN